MSDLDSFFAKKDKKKNKGKKFTTTEEIAKRLEVTEKKEKHILKEKTHPKVQPEQLHEETTSNLNAETPATSEVPEQTESSAAAATAPVVVTAATEVKTDQKVEEEEQWNDIVEPMVELANLKVARLNMEEEEERAAAGEQEEGKEGNGEEKKDGVWKIEEKKSLQSTICEAVDEGLADELIEVKATVAAQNTRWSSQAAKEMMPSPLPRGEYIPGMRRKKAAPDINNDMAFPTLANAQATGSRKKRDEHEGDHRSNRVLGGSIRGVGSRDSGLGGSSVGGAYKPPMLRVNNRYGVLTDHGSAR